MDYYYVLNIHPYKVTQANVIQPVNIYRYTKSYIRNCSNLQLGII